MRKRLAAVAIALAVLAGCDSPEPAPEVRTAEFYNHNAQRLYDGGHYDQALDQFQKALRVDPENRTALMGRAWALLTLGESQILRGRKEGAESVQLAKEAFEEMRGVDFGINSYKVDLGLGKVHVLLGDLYRARAERLREVAARRPAGDPRAASALEADRKRDESYRQAEAYFQKVLNTKGNEAARTNLVALIHLARIAVLRADYAGALLFAGRYLEQVRRSKDLWVESLRRFPKDRGLWEAKLAGAVAKEIEVRDLIANALYKLGRLEPAEEELRLVILLDPDRADAYLNRGIIRERLGRKEDAVADYRQFLVQAARQEMDAGDSRVIEATKRLLRLERELGLEPTVVPDEPRAEGGAM